MKRRWSTLSGMPILLPDQETKLGTLSGAFLDPETGQVIGFLVGFSKILSLIDIEKWRNESVQVPNPDVIVSPLEILRIQKFGVRRSFLNGKSVRSMSGKRFGRLRDFTIDTRTNTLLSFDVSKKFLGIEWDKRIFAHKDIFEITDKYIVMRFEPDAKEGSKKAIQAPQVT